MYNLQSSFCTQELSLVPERVFSLPLECLVRAEPVMNGLECARVDSIVIFDIFDIVFLSLLKIDPDDLPVQLALVDHCQGAQGLDLCQEFS